MTRPRKSSIKRKIMRVIMLTSIAVLLVNVAALMIYDLITFRQAMVQNLVTQARTIADNSTADLAYNVKSDAMNVLATLRTNPHIIAAAIYDAQGKLFVKYPASITSADLPAAPQSSGHQFGNSRLTVFQPVVQSGRQLGTLYLQSDLTLLTQRIQIYGASSLFIMAGSLLVALWLSITLQRNISNPIIMLAETARKISAARDYSLRAPKLSEDELGLLTDSFNDMLGQIETGNAALRASEAQFRFVTDQAPVLLAHMDRDYRYKFVNRPYAERYRRTPDEIIGKHAIEVVGAELFERARPNVDKALAGQLVQFELEIPGVGDERRWSHVEYTPEKNAAGEIVGFVAMHIDITERKKIEQAVRESERRERERAAELAVVIEAVPVPLIIVHDAEARHMTGNQAADNLVRIPSGAEISMSAPDDLKPNHFKSFKDGRELRIDELPAQRAAHGELVKNFEFDLVFNDGTVLNLLGSGTPLLDEQGHSRGAVHTLVDITERKRVEGILRQNEALFSALVNQAPNGVYVVDAQFQLQQINARALPAFENVQSPVGRDFSEVMEILWGPELSAEIVKIFRHTLATGERYISPRFSEMRQDLGEEKSYEWETQRVTLPDGRHGVVCYFSDITEQARAAQASQQLAAIVESSADAIISKNLNSIITSWNYGAERLFGYPATEVIGQPVTILIPEDHLDEEPKILERIRRGERIENYETIRQRKDGKLLEISLTVSPITDASGKVIGASKIARDVTKQKQAERELERAHKEAVAASRAKDDFLAALSHELRTPLNPVLLVASDAANNPQLPANTRADFDMIRRNVELEARLIDDLLDLTRITRGKLALDMQPLDTLVVLQDAITTVQADAEQKHIALEFNFRAEQYLIIGDAVRLRQIFWNVLKNAVKFTPEGGRIIIETSTLKESGKIAVKVSDTGIGLTVNELKYIFNAFSQGDHAGTTGSHRFGGLGLGLAISRMLVELHSGAIQAHSAGRDQGATFTIEFPLLSPNAEDRDASRVQDVPANFPNLAKPKRGMRILLVEDHEPTRTILTHLLTRRHYIVLAAGSVAEANALAHRENFDLVLSDIGLPDGDGYALMSELRDSFGLKGIALTGYGMDHDVTRAKNAGFVTHLTKPVRMESLEKALADVS